VFFAIRKQVARLFDLLAEAENQVSQTPAAAALRVEHGNKPGPIGQLSGLGVVPGMGVDNVFENMSR